MRFEQKDWVSLAIVIILTAVAIFQENTFLSIACVVSAGVIVAYLVWLHNDIHKAYRSLLVTVIALGVIGSSYYISNANFEKEMRRNFGRTYPSNISMPDLRCGPGDDIVLFFGPERFQIATFPYTFLYIDGNPMITYI